MPHNGPGHNEVWKLLKTYLKPSGEIILAGGGSKDKYGVLQVDVGAS